MPSKEYVSSRGTLAFGLLPCLGIIATLIIVPWNPAESPLGGIMDFALFGLMSTLLACLWLRPYHLRLDSFGYTLSGGLMFSPRTTAWQDVEEFLVCRMGRGHYGVGLNFRPWVGERSWWQKLLRPNDADDALPGSWPIPPEELAAELSEYRFAAGHDA